MRAERVIYKLNHMAVINWHEKQTISGEASLHSNNRGSSQFTKTKRVMKSEGVGLQYGCWSRWLTIVLSRKQTAFFVIQCISFGIHGWTSCLLIAALFKTSSTLCKEGSICDPVFKSIFEAMVTCSAWLVLSAAFKGSLSIQCAWQLLNLYLTGKMWKLQSSLCCFF